MIERIQSRGWRRKQRKKKGIEKSNGESKEHYDFMKNSDNKLKNAKIQTNDIEM